MTFTEKQHEIGEIIDGSKVIYDFDGVTRAAVYTGRLTDLEPAELEWQINDESADIAEICEGSPYFLTLDEIREQLEDEAPHGITVIIDDPLFGEILHYDAINNHWIRIGATMGYII